MTTVATTQTASVTEVAYSWRTDNEAHARLIQTMKDDPGITHIAAIECARKPVDSQGKQVPVRWALTPDGLTVRWSDFGDHDTPPSPWDQALSNPVRTEMAFDVGQSIRFTVLAVPEKSEPVRHLDKRGKRIPLLAEPTRREWLIGRATQVTRIDDKVKMVLYPCSDVVVESYTDCCLHSARTGAAWRAVRAELSGVVKDPKAVQHMMFGRYRAYGFGLPVFQ